MSGCDCHSAHGPALLPVDTAIARMLQALQPVQDRESVALNAALGRILAEPLVAPLALPGADNSAMDGFAVRAADLPAEGTARLPIAQRIVAGQAGTPLAPGTAARIFTGAPLPPGADTVVMQERCRWDDSHVLISGPGRPGQHIRRRGEDVQEGEPLLDAGRRLQPQDLALAAALGVDRLSVWRRPRVTILSTGDELVEPGQPLAPGQIYGSNRYLLGALLATLGCEVRDLGIVADTLDATRAALAAAADNADLVISSGGVSVGEEDHVKAAVESLGRLSLWKVAIKPGKPLAFGTVAGTPFLGLPGNPSSLFVTFLVLARPLLHRLQGRTPASVHGEWLAADFDWPRPDPRCEYLRARRVEDGPAVTRVAIHRQQSSGALAPASWADGLVELAPGQAVRQGEPVRFLSFAQLLA
ncbi:MAG TPA: gephyrin-like molybdotransferase Glp [Candidatus Competibacteraceae bacterium]|nr:gephyrin-like molybdotransferase Glp [Candidatus Competibacteraceae bacterium]